MSSLNSSAIILNKSRSKGMFIKPSENRTRPDKVTHRHLNQNRDLSARNGNKT